jgi:uncharacterized protein YvpB
MRRFLLPIIIIACSISAYGRAKVQGWAAQGTTVTTAGTSSTDKALKVYPNCTVTFYLAGTTTLTTRYDVNGSVAANPTTADSTGFWSAYLDSGRYDVRFSGSGISSPFTIGDILVNDLSSAWVPTCTGVNDTALFSSIVTAAGSNPALIKLPYLGSFRCVVNSLTLSSNITLDDSEGTGISVNSGQTLTLAKFVASRKQSFYGSGSVVFSSPLTVYPEWFGVKMDAVLLAADGNTTASSTTFTSNTKSCVNTAAPAGDINKSITILNAADVTITPGEYKALRTTISSCSGSAFVLTAAAGNTTSNTRWVYGTANATAQQKAANSLTVGGTIHVAGNAMQGSTTLLSGTTLFSYPNASMFFMTSNTLFTYSNTSNVTIDGISLDGGGFAIGGGNMTAIGGTNLSNVLIQNCILTDTFLTNNHAPVSTFSRQGILIRNYDKAVIYHNSFYNGMRIKAHGDSGNAYNADIHDNYFYNMNENGVSLLDGTPTGIAKYSHP